MCVVVLIAAYVGRYAVFRARNLAQSRELGVEGLLYVSAGELQSRDAGLRHEYRVWLYAPINGLDRCLFDGPAPVRCVLMELQ